jgi:calcium-dependent protein kinase
MDEVDEEGDIRYDNWVAALVDWQRVQQTEEWHNWILQAFSTLDRDGSGAIEFSELQQMLCEEECEVSDTVDSALREAHNHTDSRQGITLEEFERLLLSDRDNTLELYDTRLAKRQNPA